MRDPILSSDYLYDAREDAARVRRLQRLLRIISAEEGDALFTVENGIYDSTTREAVADFQGKNGLPVTGDADLDTWEALRRRAEEYTAARRMPAPIYPFPDRTRRLEAGEYSDLVLIVQIMLNALRLYYDTIAALPLSGRLDEETASAIRAFQQIHLLEETGEVDAAVWDALAAAYNRIADENQ